MKKLLAIILAAVMMLSMAACGYITPNTNPNTNASNNIGKTDTPADAPHTKHEGNGTCTVCGINYYDELVSYIQKKGTRNSDGNYEISKKENTAYSPDIYYLEYLDDENKISLRVEVESYDYYYNGFEIIIGTQSVKYHEYNWKLAYPRSGKFYYGSGPLDVSSISPNTEIYLELSYFTNTTDSDKRSAQGLAEECLYTLLNDILIPTINKLGQNITPADFGFERFE